MSHTPSKHVPIRRCVVCRTNAPRAELIRLTLQGGAYQLDAAKRAGGRGTWLCRSCAEQPDQKRLRQAFRGQAEQVAELLRSYRKTESPPLEMPRTGVTEPPALPTTGTTEPHSMPLAGTTEA